MTRVFGVKRGRDDFSPRNLMPARIFFRRYPSLHPILESELLEAARDVREKASAVLLPREASLLPALVVLAKLKPSPACTGDDGLKVRGYRVHSCCFFMAQQEKPVNRV